MKLKMSTILWLVIPIGLTYLTIVALLDWEWLTLLTIISSTAFVLICLVWVVWGQLIYHRRRFHIKKGDHFSELHFRPVYKIHTLEFYFRLNPNCFTLIGFNDERLTQEQKDAKYSIKKLFGVVLNGIHGDSARLGWTTEQQNSKLGRIFAYTYIDGKRVLNPNTQREPIICDVTLGEEYFCSIVIDKNTREIQYNIFEGANKNSIGKHTISGIEASKFDNWNWNRLSFPYYGGTQVAPHDMDIDIQVTHIK